MYTIVYKPSKAKTVLLIMVSLLAVVSLYQILKYYLVHYLIVTGVVVSACVGVVVRAVGVFLMYPGTYRFLAADMEKNENDYLLQGMHTTLLRLQALCTTILTLRCGALRASMYKLSARDTMDNIRMHATLIGKCEHRSTGRMQLIQLYEQLILLMDNRVEVKQHQLSAQHQGTVSMSTIMSNPHNILKLESQQKLHELRQVAQQIMRLVRRIWQQCQSLTSIPTPQQTQSAILPTEQSSHNIKSHDPEPKLAAAQKHEVAHWHLFSQKLFTMDSYFAYWDRVFIYTTFVLDAGAGNRVQCAIIHGDKEQAQSYVAESEKPCVLFCCPNGVMFQSFALTSTYMKFYLKSGLRVCLWNYRGYAKSTGIATINNCISDVHKIYQHLTQVLKIDVRVVHGYSIGGVPAISLVETVNKQGNKPIKLLIADRTFSSIDRVALGFVMKVKLNVLRKLLSAIARPIVRLFFMSDCMDSAPKFLKCQCSKVVLYSPGDQVIASPASIKQAIQSMSLEKDQQLKQWVINYGEAVAKLYRKWRKVYEKVMGILYDLDGGGVCIDLQLDLELQNGKRQISIQQLVRDSRQYLTGLCVYGPKIGLPHFNSIAEQQKYVKKRLEMKINLLKQCENNIPQDQCQIRLPVAEIIKCVSFAKDQICGQKMRKKRQQLGQLIVCQVGHNSELKRQYYALEDILKRSLNDTEKQQQQNL